MRKKILITILGVLLSIPLFSVNTVFALGKSIQAINDMGQISNNGPRLVIPYGEDEGYVYYGASGINIIHGEQTARLETNFEVLKLISVSDINNDGYTDFLTYQKAPDFSGQLLVIDGLNGNVLSTLQFTREGYDENLGFINTNSYIQQMVDLGNGEALIVYDYNIAKVNLLSGEVLFTFTETDNIWDVVVIDDIDGDGLSEIAYSGQQNVVGVISGADGTALKTYNPTTKRTITLTWDDRQSFEAVMNCWDVEFINGKLFATTEDGLLVSFDLMTDEMTSVSISVMDEEMFNQTLQRSLNWIDGTITYMITGVNRWQYMGYKIVDHNENYLLIDAFLGDLNSISQYQDSTYPARVIVYDLSTNEVASKISLDNFGCMYEKTCFGIYEEQPCVATVNYTEKGLAKMALYSLSGELLLQHDLKLDIVDFGKKIELSWTGENYILEVLNGGTVNVSADLSETSYCYDSITSSLLKVYDDRMTVLYSTNGTKDKIVQYDKDLSTVLWEFNVDKDFKNKGLEFIRTDIDYDRDGEEDILAIVNCYDKNDSPVYSNFIIVSSKGEVIRNKNVVTNSYWYQGSKVYEYLVSTEFGVLNDTNDDGIYELLCGDTIITSKSNTVIGSTSAYLDAKGSQYKIGDINGDGVSDILLMTETEGRIYLSRVAYSYGYIQTDYRKTNTTMSLDKTLEPLLTTVIIDDINNDGVKELGMIDRNDNGFEIFKIVNGATLEKMYDLCVDGINEDGEAFKPLSYDINGDGYNELYGRDNWQYGIYDGKTGTLLVNYTEWVNEGEYYSDEYHPTYNVPFYVMDEEPRFIVTEIDGVKTVAFTRSRYDREVGEDKNYISMWSGENFENEETVPLVRNNDGSLGTLRSIENSNGYALLTLQDSISIVDLKNKSMLAKYAVTAKSGYQFDENTILVVNNEDVLYKLDTQNSFTVTSEVPATTDNYILHLSWEDSQDYSVMTIYDNDRAVYSGSDKEADIKLIQGDHRIMLSMNDGQGKSYQETYNVTVAPQPVNYIWMIAVAIVLVIIAFMLGRYQKIAINRKYRKEASK